MFCAAASSQSMRRAVICALVVASGAVAGCAANGAGSAITTGSAAGGKGCKTMQASIDKLYKGGVAGKTAAASAGKVLSAKARGEVRQYNALLTRYVESKCHK